MKVKAVPHQTKVVVELESRDEGLLKPMPFHIRHILVPVDFSDTACKALQYAVPFARAFDAEVSVVHVVQPYTVPTKLGFMEPEIVVNHGEIVDAARKELDRLCAREMGGGVHYQAQVREGVPWHEVVTAAGEINADLIILATHGRTGLQHALLGSVAERVVRHASCPVLVVRKRERDFVPTAE
jgi:universal stress protein A